MTQPSMPPSTELDGPPGTAPVRWLAGAAAVVALVFCLLGLVGGVGVSDLAGVLVVGGGLLASTVALPKAGRVLAPSAVAVTLGVLVLLQAVMTSRVTGLLVAALVVAFVEMVTVVGALLVDVGVVARSAERPSAAADAAPSAVAWGPGPADPTTTYADGYPRSSAASGVVAGEPAAVPPSGADAFPVGPSGAVPRYGLSTPPSGPVERATEVAPWIGPVRPPAPAGPNGSGDTTAVPGYGVAASPSSTPGLSPSGSEPPVRVNGSSVPHGPLPGPDEQSAVRPSVNGTAPGHGPRAPGGPTEAGVPAPPNGSGPRPGFSPSGVPLGAAPFGNGPAAGRPTPGATSSAGPDATMSVPPGVLPMPGPPSLVNGGSEAGPKAFLGGAPIGGSPTESSLGSEHAPSPGRGPAGPGADGGASRGRSRGPDGLAPHARRGSERSASDAGVADFGPSEAGSAESVGVSSTVPVQAPAAPVADAGVSGVHRAPAVDPSPAPPSPGRSAGRTGAHRAPTSGASLFGPPELDAAGSRDRPTPGPALRPSPGDDGLPRRRPSPSGADGYRTPLPFAPFEERGGPRSASGRSGLGAEADGDRPLLGPGGLFQPLPRGAATPPGSTAAASGRSAEPRSGLPDPSSGSTVFRPRAAPEAADETPAWGHDAYDGPDATRGTQSWLDAPPPREPTGSSSHGRGGRHGTEQGRHGSRDGADPDDAPYFPSDR